MRAIQRVTTLLVLLLTVLAANAAAQDRDKSDAFDDEMRKAEMLIPDPLILSLIRDPGSLIGDRRSRIRE